jgi:hypothetical protein
MEIPCLSQASRWNMFLWKPVERTFASTAVVSR